MNNILLVDGHSLAFRSYFAYGGTDGGLRTSTGIPTSVCYGFLKALLGVLEAEPYSHVAIAFDHPTPTFRHQARPTYKAGRSKPLVGFADDMKNLKRLLGALNLTRVSIEGYEADDVIGTIALQVSNGGHGVSILSGDQDVFQLIGERTKIIYTASRPGVELSVKEVKAGDVQEKLGIMPHQVVDYKALCGDKSDNIPGVKGIGEKTALKLLKEYGTLEQIYTERTLVKLPIATHKKLEAGSRDAFDSQYLARIVTTVPIPTLIEDYRVQGFNLAALMPILEELELKQFKDKIERIASLLSKNAQISSITS